MSDHTSETVNIQVVVRARPLNESELHKTTNLIKMNSTTSVVESRKKPFSFDAVFPSNTTEEEFFLAAVQHTLNEFLKGFNCSIFAYGETGSGKTYTMAGEAGNGGVIPRSVDYLFQELNENEIDFELRCSFMEVYNEEIYDLLEDVREPLKLFEERQQTNAQSKTNKLVVQNLTEVLVNNPKEVLQLLSKAASNRKTAETLMNERSSRSHSIFCIQLIEKEIEINQNTNQEIEFIKISKLNLVDLAGSENISKSGASGQQLEEASRINKSLLTFGRVINCLTENKPHVPYRESKLTRILQDSLGGKTRTAIIATISLSDLQIEETTSTLDYMTRAKKIKNAPEIMQKINSKTLLKEQTTELKRLRALLDAQRVEQGGIFVPEEEYGEYQDFVNSRNDRVKELEVLIEQQLADIAKISQVLDIQQGKYNIVKRELKNAVGHISGEHESLEVFQQKIALGRVQEEHNEEELESRKLDFQVCIDNEFSVAELSKLLEAGGYKDACTEFAKAAAHTQKSIIDESFELIEDFEESCKIAEAEFERNLKVLIFDSSEAIQNDLTQNIAIPIGSLDSKSMSDMIETEVQKRLSLITKGFVQEFITFESSMGKILEDNERIIADETSLMTENSRAICEMIKDFSSTISKRISDISSNLESFKREILEEAEIENSNFKEAVLKEMSALCENHAQKSADNLERDLLSLEQGSNSITTEMEKEFTEITESVRGIATDIECAAERSSKHAAHSLTVGIAEVNKLERAIGDHNTEIAETEEMMNELLKEYMMKPIENVEAELAIEIENIKMLIEKTSSNASGQLVGMSAEHALKAEEMVKTFSKNINMFVQRFPEMTAVQKSITETLKLLEESVNSLVLSNLQEIEYRTVLPKNHTPTIVTPPFRGMGVENSGIIGIETPTIRREEITE